MTQFRRHSNGEVLSLSTAQKLGGGGEGTIYSVASDPLLAAKIYHKPGAEQQEKLLAMYDNPPDDPMRSKGHASIAWPVDLLYSNEPESRNRVLGFLMPRVQDTFPVIDMFVPRSRLEKCPLFTYQYLHRAARNIAVAVAALHSRGYVVGDINESNILVSTSALVTLVDTDSFQVRTSAGRVFRCGVGKAEFTPPEIQGINLRDVDRTPAQDLFGLSVLIFQMLMEGAHPYNGQYLGEGDPPGIATRIQRGWFPYGGVQGEFRPPPSAPDFEMLDPEIRALFLACFVDGYTTPGRRPTALTWMQALESAEGRLRACRRNRQHRYGKHLKSCPWCARAQKLGGRDYYPSKRAVDAAEHLTPVVPKQTALPPLQSSSAPATPSTLSASAPKPRTGSRKPSPTSSTAVPNWVLRWEDWAKRHHAVYAAICAGIGCGLLGGLRYLCSKVLPEMRGWMTHYSPVGNRESLSLAIISLVVGGIAITWGVLAIRFAKRK